MWIRSGLTKLFHSPYLRIGLGLALSALTLYLALRNVTFSELWMALSQADPIFIGLALVSVGVNTFAKAIRWKVLLGDSAKKVHFSRLFAALLVGQMLNTVYPGRVGELGRAYAIGGMGPGRVFTLGTIFLEKLLDMLSYILLFGLLILLIPLPDWVNSSVYGVGLVVLVTSLGVLILAYRPRHFIRVVEAFLHSLPDSMNWRVTQWFHSGMSSLETLQTAPSLVMLAAWSGVIWATAILNNQLALWALHISVPWTASLLVLMVLQVGITIPSVPGKFGIFEYSCILALAVFGIEQAPALSYGILLHGIVLLPTTILGWLFFWFLGLGNRNPRFFRSSPKELGTD